MNNVEEIKDMKRFDWLIVMLAILRDPKMNVLPTNFLIVFLKKKSLKTYVI